jgi:hypothetical protein
MRERLQDTLSANMAAILLQYPLPTVAALTILGTTSAYFVLGHLLKRLAYARFTVLGNLKDFGRARSSDTAIAERVVICGGRCEIQHRSSLGCRLRRT